MRLFISVKLRSFYDWCGYKLLPLQKFHFEVETNGETAQLVIYRLCNNL